MLNESGCETHLFINQNPKIFSNLGEAFRPPKVGTSKLPEQLEPVDRLEIDEDGELVLLDEGDDVGPGVQLAQQLGLQLMQLVQRHPCAGKNMILNIFLSAMKCVGLLIPILLFLPKRSCAPQIILAGKPNGHFYFFPEVFLLL